MLRLSRRQLLALGGALAAPAPRVPAGSKDPVAEIYREALHLHTRWVEQQWDAGLGAYRLDDFRFTAVLGNAVLLTTGKYDAALAGVSERRLRERTLATIARFAG